MRKLLFTTAVLLSLGIPGFAQRPTVGGTTTNVAVLPQSGYAVITPDSSGTQLVVMETFGLRTANNISTAGFGPPAVVTSATIFVDVAERLDRNLALAIANPDPLDATITFTLHGADGKYIGARTFSLPSHNQFDKFITELVPLESPTSGQAGSLKEFTGTLSIISSVPVSVLGLRFRGSEFSVLPVAGDGISNRVPLLGPEIGGPSAILLPQYASDGGWVTQLVVTNPATFKVNFRLDLFKGDGSPLTTTLDGITSSSFTELSVPPGGVIVLVPRDEHGDHQF